LKKRGSLSLSLLRLAEKGLVVISCARLKSLSSRGAPPPLATTEEKTTRDDDESGEMKERDPRETKAGKKLKNRISSRFALISIFFLVQKDLKKRGKGKEGEENFLERVFG